MKKSKPNKPRRPAKHEAKRVDLDMYNESAISRSAPREQNQATQRRQNRGEQSEPKITSAGGSQRKGMQSTPRVFDQAVQPIPRQEAKKQGMQQIVMPVATSQAVSPNNGQDLKRQRRPKKAEKRITRGEARRKRFRKNLLTFIILSLVVVAGITLSIMFLFKIEKFEIVGESTYSQQDLELAFGVPSGENIFSFNIKDVQTKMSASLPYAETVSVRRRLPNTVVFSITQAVESYYTENADGGYVVLSEQLKVLRLSPEPPQDLPFITGAEALLPKAGSMLVSSTEGKLASINNTIDAIVAEGLTPFNTLDVTNILEISFVYDKRAKVILGTSNDLEDKLALAGVILREKIGEFEKGTLDVSNKSADKDRQGIWLPGNI